MNVHDRTLFAWTCQHVFVFVPVFAWMSLRDFAWQAELFFLFVLASGRRQFERGLQLFSFSSCISLFILFLA